MAENNLGKLELLIIFAAFTALAAACTSKPLPGPDKQGSGTISGAAWGAGAGAVTAAQVSASTGPGALVGAGIGAIAGGIKGYAKDQAEEDLLELSANTWQERDRAYAQHMLSEHLKRRVELHPSRDIYPADLFFDGDDVRLRPGAEAIINEIARLSERRFPYSRLVITSYIKTTDDKSEYAYFLGSKRCRVMGDELIEAGLEPRRIETRVVLVNQPVLIDPNDRPDRYNQAIELTPIDR